jgi:hypothetical protein
VDTAHRVTVAPRFVVPENAQVATDMLFALVLTLIEYVRITVDAAEIGVNEVVKI